MNDSASGSVLKCAGKGTSNIRQRNSASFNTFLDASLERLPTCGVESPEPVRELFRAVSDRSDLWSSFLVGKGRRPVTMV